MLGEDGEEGGREARYMATGQRGVRQVASELSASWMIYFPTPVSFRCSCSTFQQYIHALRAGCMPDECDAGQFEVFHLN